VTGSQPVRYAEETHRPWADRRPAIPRTFHRQRQETPTRCSQLLRPKQAKDPAHFLSWDVSWWQVLGRTSAGWADGFQERSPEPSDQRDATAVVHSRHRLGTVEFQWAL